MTTWGIRGQWRCSPKIAASASRPMRQLFSSACRTCGYIGRDNGAPVGGGAVVAGVAVGSLLGDHLPPSRKGTRWDQLLQMLVVSYRLSAPGSEWKLHRDWFGKSAWLTC